DILQRQAYRAMICTLGHVYAAHGCREHFALLHREVLGTATEKETTFKNGNTLDCRRANLHSGTRAEVTRGSRSKRTAASRFKGVSSTRTAVSSGVYFYWAAT